VAPAAQVVQAAQVVPAVAVVLAVAAVAVVAAVAAVATNTTKEIIMKTLRIVLPMILLLSLSLIAFARSSGGGGGAEEPMGLEEMAAGLPWMRRKQFIFYSCAQKKSWPMMFMKLWAANSLNMLFSAT
jgi:hypothetical protein